LQARAVGKTLEIISKNVRSLKIHAEATQFFGFFSQIRWNGMVFNADWKNNRSVILGSEELKGKKRASQYGPFRRLIEGPVLVVLGRGASPEEKAVQMELAREISLRHWDMANAGVRILWDDEVTAPLRRTHHLFILGGSRVNRESERYGSVPISCGENGLKMEGKLLKPWRGALLTSFPNPEGSKYLIGTVCSNDLDSLRKLSAFFPHADRLSLGVPDFLAIQAGDQSPWESVVLAGFYDRNWNLDSESTYCSICR
jgi:hypothetical protein